MWNLPNFLATVQAVRGSIYRILNIPSVNVKIYGAVGDGVTDDTAAFNAITTYVRTLLQTHDSSKYINVNISIPPGDYSVSSWDLTGLLGRSVHIVGHGATLVANTAGKNVVDAIGTRWIRFHGLKVRSPSTVLARSGIQIGPKGTETCGNNSFRDVEIIGHFEAAPLLNLGSETTSHYNCTYLQRSETAGTYAYIGDGLAAAFLPTSDYQTITRTSGTAVSFTNNAHYGCQIRHEGGGDCLFLSRSSGWTFDRQTYWLSYNGSAARLYGTSTQVNSDITLSGLFETDFDDQPTVGNVGIKHVVTFDGDGTDTAIEGFVLETLSPHVETSVFTVASGGAVRVSDARIRVQTLYNASATFFSGASALTIHGYIETRESSKLNLNNIAEFVGTLNLDAFGALGKPAAGAFTAFSTSGKRVYLTNPVITDTSGNSLISVASDGATTITTNTASNALRVTQTGSGNALVVEDSANPDSTPFVIDASGNMGIGKTPVVKFDMQLGGSTHNISSNGNTILINNAFGGVNVLRNQRYSGNEGSQTIVSASDELARFEGRGYDGANPITAAQISMSIDGTPGTNDMPGRIVFSTTPDGASSATESMRLDSKKNVIIGTGQLADAATDGFLYIPGTTSGAPSGTPTTYSGRHPMVFDDTNNKLYIYNGSAWVSTTLT